MGSAISTLASVGMAVGPPLVYADQFRTIVQKKDSSGFSKDVCGVLIFANITRLFFWLGVRFELTLLVQSVLMVAAQYALLFVCLRYGRTGQVLLPEANSETPESEETDAGPPPKRPYDFWQWPNYGKYVESTAVWIIFLALLYLCLSWSDIFVSVLGFFALGLESTLPIPQLLTNHRRRTLAGFSPVVLAGWAFGDSFKLVYFLAQKSGWQFTVCAMFQLGVDMAICWQAYLYGWK